VKEKAMTLRRIVEARIPPRPRAYDGEPPSDIYAKWAAAPLAVAEAENTITIFDVIGKDIFGDGFTAKRMGAALRAIGRKDVTVLVNSPGGDVFEAMTIYNLLRDHAAKVTVKVMGMAASAASIIAMAGDEIRMGSGTFMMIHNAWGVVIGNRHEMREAADLFDGFDAALVDIYESRTGLSREDLGDMMDKETYLNATDAVSRGFADGIDEGVKGSPAALAARTDTPAFAKRRIESLLAGTGLSRADRRKLIATISAGTPDAARAATLDAGFDPATAERLIAAMKPRHKEVIQ
jgi:ATP-dependent protease ClpP protease subunit